MIILTLRTDKPVAEIGIFENSNKLSCITWEAHRKLAETLHISVRNLLKQQNMKWEDIDGIVIYEGPGSFTGLRIGFSVANALAYSNNVQITSSGGEEWINQGIARILDGKGQKSAVPDYGMPAHITQQKK